MNLLNDAVDDVTVRTELHARFDGFPVSAGMDDLPHVELRSKQQRPVHEGFHVAVDMDVAREIGKEEDPVRLQHFQASARELHRHLFGKVIVKPGGVDEIELAELL